MKKKETAIFINRKPKSKDYLFYIPILVFFFSLLIFIFLLKIAKIQQ